MKSCWCSSTCAPYNSHSFRANTRHQIHHLPDQLPANACPRKAPLPLWLKTEAFNTPARRGTAKGGYGGPTLIPDMSGCEIETRPLASRRTPVAARVPAIADWGGAAGCSSWEAGGGVPRDVLRTLVSPASP